jgi:hypothetical protein
MGLRVTGVVQDWPGKKQELWNLIRQNTKKLCASHIDIDVIKISRISQLSRGGVYPRPLQRFLHNN